MKPADYEALFRRYQSGETTPEEQAIVEDYILNHEFEPLYLSEEELSTAKAKLGQRISGIPFVEQAPVRLYRRWNSWKGLAGVAAAVAAIVFGVWFYNANYKNGRHPEFISGSPLANDIAPGKNTATIKIGDGAAITLSDKQTGVIVGDELRYSDGSKISGRHPEFISGSQGSRGGGPDLRQDDVVVTTPRGGTYQVTLPDGTKVWLNAASRLTYTMPLKERGGIRKVELSGEAYFEVFRNKNQPFVVSTKNLTTTVLGTHFNISAYDDEGSVKATLLEGSVKVAINGRHPEFISGSRTSKAALQGRGPDLRQDDGEGVVLKPNQQATLTSTNKIKVQDVTAEDAVAWKNGYFMFNNESLESVMERIARWYNVKIIYEDAAIKTGTVFGTISRFENVSKVLRMLERADVVQFTLEGNTIKIKKKK